MKGRGIWWEKEKYRMREIRWRGSWERENETEREEDSERGGER